MLWLILGLIIGGGLVYIIFSDKYKVAWYQWVLGATSIVLILLTIQNILGFVRELEPVAITFTLIVMGIPAVILGALAILMPRFVSTSNKLSKDGSSKSV